jgi:methylisocitrate lyase
MATFALVPLMSAAAALKENLAQLYKDKSSANLPRPVMAHDPFIDFIGFKEIEAQQLEYLPNPLATKAAAA